MSRNDPTIYLGDLSIVAGLTHDGDRQALNILRDIDPDNYQVRAEATQRVRTIYAQELRKARSAPLKVEPEIEVTDWNHGRSPFWAGMIK